MATNTIKPVVGDLLIMYIGPSAQCRGFYQVIKVMPTMVELARIETIFTPYKSRDPQAGGILTPVKNRFIECHFLDATATKRRKFTLRHNGYSVYITKSVYATLRDGTPGETWCG